MSKEGVLKTIGAIVCIGISSEVMYQVYLLVKNKIKNNNNANSKNNGTSINRVLFFPDNSVACKRHFVYEEGCKNNDCRFSHEKNSLSEFFRYLNQAQLALDICVFTISCQDLVEIILSRAKAGVRVRVITDDDQVDVPGSQIWRLRSHGIALRTDNSSFFMHHKFVIVDGGLLINGSFNWTRQAITGNQENLMILNQPDIVKEYKAEFNKLWEQFDPSKQNSKRNLHMNSAAHHNRFSRKTNS